MPEKIKKLRGSIATYKCDDGILDIDLDELCEAYSHYHNIPEAINAAKAVEICALANEYLRLKKIIDKSGIDID